MGKKKKSGFLHIIFAVLALMLLGGIVIMVVRWNIGEESQYDPNEDTSEFDVETNDYIQPLSAADLEGRREDEETTVMLLGNSPFADMGRDNLLAAGLAEVYDANIINGGLEGSFLSCESENMTSDLDRLSLYSVCQCICSGNFAPLMEAATENENISWAVENLSGADMSAVDCIMIMYDLKDYIKQRPAVTEGNEYSLASVGGSLNAALRLLKESYPYIRIVVLSTPACGETIDNYYVDGDVIDFGYGTLTDYMGHEIYAAINNGVSFVDLYYGAINVDNRQELLVDDYHLSREGAEVIAERVAALIELQG